MSTTGSTQPSRPDIRSSPSVSSENVRARNSGTGCCWSGNASDLAKTSCRQSLQAFIAGNSPLLRILFIQYLWVATLSVFCWALDHVARFLRRNFSRSSFYRGYLEEPCLWVETNNTTLSLLSSNAELALGFLLIISLFSWRRNFIHTFMYWNVLKMMYHALVTIQLPPEHVGEDRADREPVHRPLPWHIVAHL
ncbi:transmembrane protein 33 [Hordeum vulgare]|nr:transmembrane protein 33 [Hordeum vulgare]